MSPIYGTLARTTGSLDPSVPAAMRGALQAWAGPGGGEWTRGCATLGTVEDRAEPASRPAGRPLIVADARLDDRADLARELGEPLSTPDDRLILAAYERWGARCPEHLIGAFAFAVWDERRSTLFCARDHIGLRPLYFWQGGGEFLLASDPAALLATGRPSGEADEMAFVAKLVDHHGILRERSFHAGIAKLPPGETLEVTPAGAMRRGTHWAPARRETLRLPRPEAYAAALREALEVAVGAAVARPGERVGAHFSGGLDSSAVAVMAHRHLARAGGGLEGLFSWSPAPSEPLSEDDERRRLLPLADALGLGVSWTSLTPEDLSRDAAMQAGLVPSESLLYEHAILREARARGIGVMLSGWGGDETASFHGHGHAKWLARTGRWRTLLHETRTSSRGRGHRGLRLARNVTVRMLRAPFKPGDDGAVWTDLSALHPLAAELQRDVARRTRTRLAPRDTQLALLTSGHLTNRVETWVAAGARHGVDYRFPMLDRRLIDLCLSFPSEVWVRDGVARWPFRTAMAGILPHELCWAGKTEPGRIGAYLDLFMDERPPPAGAAGTRAGMVALVRERQREALRRQGR